MQRKFLGYQIWYYGILLIAYKSIDRFKDKVRAITRRNRGKSFQQIITELNQLIPGWVRYFRYAKAKSKLEDLDTWIRRKLRCYKLKQFKKRVTIARNLQKMGVPEWSAWLLAMSGKGWWKLSNTPQAASAMNLTWFKEQGLHGLSEIYSTL